MILMELMGLMKGDMKRCGEFLAPTRAKYPFFAMAPQAEIKEKKIPRVGGWNGAMKWDGGASKILPHPLTLSLKKERGDKV